MSFLAGYPENAPLSGLEYPFKEIVLGELELLLDLYFQKIGETKASAIKKIVVYRISITLKKQGDDLFQKLH